MLTWQRFHPGTACLHRAGCGACSHKPFRAATHLCCACRAQLVAALLQAKERGDPQGWLAFQVGVVGLRCCCPSHWGLAACLPAWPAVQLTPASWPINCGRLCTPLVGLQTEVSALKLQRTRVEREADDLQVRRDARVLVWHGWQCDGLGFGVGGG